MQRGAFWNLYFFLDSFPVVGQNYYQILPLFSLEIFSNETVTYVYFMTFVLISKAYFHLKDLPFP